MKKILYLMHVDWNWIKQRPHFLALELSKKHEVSLYYPLSWRKKSLTVNNKMSLDINPFRQLPYIGKYRIINLINEIHMNIYFRKVIKEFKPDIIWLTHPMFYPFIESIVDTVSDIKVVYDCMDDIQEFTYRDFVKQKFLDYERKLISKASTIFVSSNHLKGVIARRGKAESKIKLVRNAFSGDAVNEIKKLEVKHYSSPKKIKIGYIGTISDWFDIDILVKATQETSVQFVLIGPVENVSLKDKVNSQIELFGPVDHDKLFEVVHDFDCLMMPFKVNDLILSVDPVKLYEYISFNKPIISVYYPEVERFEDFVYFYNNYDEFLKLITRCVEEKLKKQYTDEEKEIFLITNTWENRREIIETEIKEL